MAKWTLHSRELTEDSESGRALLNERLDKFLLAALQTGYGEWESEEGEEPEAFTRSQIQNWIEAGRVSLDGKTLEKASLKLATLATSESLGFERLELTVPDPEPLELIPEERDLDILFQDEHLLVVNKPPRLTVHPSETQRTGTLVHALLHHVKDLSGIGGVLRPGIVHRIDKDTSGALVITKTDRAHLALSETFSKHEIERRYWALCYGAPEWSRDEHRLETRIGRHPTDRKRMSTEVKEGRKAVSHFRRLEAYGISGKKPFASLIEAKLETGRTHQVRVHLTSLHHSILGDPLYGEPTSQQPKWKALPEDVRDAVESLPGQALHARTLGFRHPITGADLRFEAEPPAEFQRLLDTLRRYQ